MFFYAVFMKIREYLKLARSFNAVLTGVSPVMGAVAMQEYNVGVLVVLFLIGFLGHSFGFVLNDILDFNLDNKSREISDRPLISGTISLKNAWIFAIGCLALAFVIAFALAYPSANFFPLVLMVVSAASIVVYNVISKKYPFMDVFVGAGIFFFILYGAVAVSGSLSAVSDLAWIVCVLGTVQVMFMQIVAGGMKDIENDFLQGARTAAVRMGVRVNNGKLKVSRSFFAVAFVLQIVDIVLVFSPFFLFSSFSQISVLTYVQFALLGLISVLMLVLSYRLLTMKDFVRKQARKYIGSHYMINFALVPVMLMTLNPYAILIAFMPALGFVLSNVVLHGTLLQPKTM